MIKEVPLEQSDNYQIYEYNTLLYNKGIKTDSCIIVNGLEFYYNKKEEVIYVDSFQSFCTNEEDFDEEGEITKEMLQELVNYLKWDNWSINLYYFDYEEAIIKIRKKDD